jgi:hypothetical protein
MRAAKSWWLLCAILFLGVPAAAQVSEQRLVDMMLDCTTHADGGIWQPKTLLKDGLLRFTHLHETRNLKPGPYDYKDERRYLYVAFWNPSETQGEFLDFSIDKSGGKDWLSVSNSGEISVFKGKLNFEFFQGGEWMREHYLIRVRKLRAAPLRVVAVRDVRRTGVLCDSFAHPHPEWDPNSQPPKPR